MNTTYCKKLVFVFLLSTLFVYGYAETSTTTPSSISKTTQKVIPKLTKEQFDKLSKEDQQKFIQSFVPPFVKNNNQAPTSTPQEINPSVVNCFDYYKFGSVQVDVSANVLSATPGIPLTFSGQIKNANDYPIVQGQVYAKVFYKNQKDNASTHQNGYQLVDQFIVLDDVNLQAKGNKPISFIWQVPEYAQDGDYQIAMFFISAYRYNLLGLTFTDDVVGNISSFSIKSNSKAVSYFDKNNVMLNDTLFRFAAFPPHFTKNEKVVVYPTLINPTNKETVVDVTWKLYAWDAMLPEHLKSAYTELINLKPYEHKILSYDVKSIDSSVSYLVVEAKDQDAKSILDIRFVRDKIEETRINFPSILEYPLKGGQKNTVFSCVHSTNLPVVKDNILTLTLKDDKGEVIHTYTYKGDITGEMMGLKDVFTPKKTYTNFSLTATLERNGIVIENVTMVYDCNKIDVTQCKKINPIILYVIAIVLIIAGATVVVTKKRRK